jgi:hypothetical protein
MGYILEELALALMIGTEFYKAIRKEAGKG